MAIIAAMYLAQTWLLFPTTLAQASRTEAFWLLAAAFFFGNVSSQTLHVHQVAYLVDHGLTAIVDYNHLQTDGTTEQVTEVTDWLMQRQAWPGATPASP